MELAKLIIKIVYLFVLVGLCYAILSNQTPLIGMNLYVLSLFIGVLLMYFTFNYVYRFLINSQLILKLTKTDDVDEVSETTSTTKKTSPSIESTSQTQKEENIHVSDSSSTSNDFIMDHSHKFLEDNVFSMS